MHQKNYPRSEQLVFWLKLKKSEKNGFLGSDVLGKTRKINSKSWKLEDKDIGASF